MNSPETAGATRRSLTRDWLYALQYWLRGRNGVIALVVLAPVIGAALNWSWLGAFGRRFGWTRCSAGPFKGRRRRAGARGTTASPQREGVTCAST